MCSRPWCHYCGLRWRVITTGLKATRFSPSLHSCHILRAADPLLQDLSIFSTGNTQGPDMSPSLVIKQVSFIRDAARFYPPLASSVTRQLITFSRPLPSRPGASSPFHLLFRAACLSPLSQASVRPSNHNLKRIPIHWRPYSSASFEDSMVWWL